jgi:hypothetical protein
MDSAANAMDMHGSFRCAMSGLAFARSHSIRQGEVLYRFIDVTRAPSPVSAANGPWWLEYQSFQQIKHFGSRHGYSLDYSARLFAAILYEWSEVTGYVRAEVLQPLQAWKGRGKQVQSKGTDGRDLPTMTPMYGPSEIYQLFIPGLYRGKKLFPVVMRFLDYVPI